MCSTGSKLLYANVYIYEEDAPAPMALHSFKTSVVDGKINVTANTGSTLKDNMSRQATLLATGVNSSGKGVVIVGGGSGTFHAVESLREVNIYTSSRANTSCSFWGLAWLFRPHNHSFQRNV